MSQPQTTEKETVHAVFDAIDKQNLDVFDELIAEDVTTGIYRSGSEEDIIGRDGMRELWKEYWESFPDLEGISTDLIQEGNRVAVFREEKGTHEGEFRGIEPTGEEITFTYSGFLEIEDGQVVHAYFHGDMLNLLNQLGIESPFPEP